MDLVIGLFSLLWWIWPVMFLAVLEGAINRRGKINKLGAIALRNLTLAWVCFLAIRIFLDASGQLMKPILPETLFWLTGMVLAVLHSFRIISDATRSIKRLRGVEGQASLRVLSPENFEQTVADTYRALGNQVKVVGSQGDHGIDLIVHASNGEKRVVQCKRWSGKVGEPVVRDFFGAMQHEGASEGAIVTTGAFTAQARQWAKGKPIRLYDGDEFLQIVKKAGALRGGQVRMSASIQPIDLLPVVSIPPAANEVAPATDRQPYCRLCGKPMVLRTAKRGPTAGEQFWGCSNYPDCRETFPLDWS